MLNDEIKKKLNINSTLEELNLSSLTIEIDQPTKEVFAKFETDQASPGIIITNRQKYAGMVSRKLFFELMSKPYSLELFMKRSIETFYQDLENNEPLLVPVSMPISSATSLALQRNIKDIYEPLVVLHDNHSYSILDIEQLLLAQSTIHTQLVDQLNHNVNYVKNLLNNSGQGFLTIKNDLYVESQYSNECRNIFGYEIEQMFFPKIIFPSDERQQLFLSRILIRILNESDKKTFNKYLPLLPEETVLEDKIIQINYKLINNTDKSGKKKFMIILTDISDKRNLESRIESERNILKMVVKVVSNQNVFNECVKDFTEFHRYILPDIVNSNENLENILSEVYRQIHTFKGNFSQIDMVHVVKNLHEAESEISQFNKIKGSNTKQDFYNFIEELKMHTFLQEDMDILKDILGDNFLSNFDTIKIQTKKFDEIENKLKQLPFSDNLEAILYELRKLRSENAKNMLTPLVDYCMKLAENNQKKIKSFCIEGDDVFINKEEYGNLFKSLIHIFRNAVDHGIELPEERAINNKSEEGEIQCELHLKDTSIVIKISDDGNGIDIPRLKRRLITSYNLNPEEIKKLTDNEIIKYIFRDGITTKESVSELSGRGMGLSSVYSEVEKLGGSIHVNSYSGSGTEFIITIPIKQTLIDFTDDTKNILDIILKTTQSFLKNDINLQNILLNTITEYNNERLNLKTFTSFISVKGLFDAKVIITIEHKLAKYLLNHFVGDEISFDEEYRYLEDTVSETLNNIIGNSTQELADRGRAIEFGNPVIMTSEEAIFKYPPTKKWNCSVKTDQGDFLLYIIQ